MNQGEIKHPEIQLIHVCLQGTFSSAGDLLQAITSRADMHNEYIAQNLVFSGTPKNYLPSLCVIHQPREPHQNQMKKKYHLLSKSTLVQDPQIRQIRLQITWK